MSNDDYKPSYVLMERIVDLVERTGEELAGASCQAKR
jgi:hypothetical protein